MSASSYITITDGFPSCSKITLLLDQISSQPCKQTAKSEILPKI